MPEALVVSFSNIMDSNSYRAEGSADPLIVSRERVLGPAYRLFYDQPVHLVRGQGSHLFDVDGVRYLDAYNNVASVGHCHPQVVEAVSRQMATLNTHTRYLHRDIVEYSERLLGSMPDAVDQVMYACTGSEANDLALRVAEMRTAATGVVITRDAYHGNTASTTAISPSLGGATSVGPNVRVVDPPDTYRLNADEVAARFTADVSRAADELIAAGYGMSSLIVDTIFSSDGIYADTTGARPRRRRGTRPRRGVHRRRGTARLRPHRGVDVGLRPARPGPRHRDNGKADGERHSR